MKTLALLPAHNEVLSLARVVAELRAHQPGLDVLIVDDASTDGTPELLPTLSVRWLRLSVHLGVGGAVRAGLRYARAQGYQAVVRLDADGQHPAEMVTGLLRELSTVDAVVASRYRVPTQYETPLARRLAQRLLATVLSMLTRQTITDPTSGYWAFGPKAVRLLAEHHPSGYGEPALALLLTRNGLRYSEVSVTMRARHAGTSTLTLPRATAALAQALLAMLVVPFRAQEKGAHDD